MRLTRQHVLIPSDDLPVAYVGSLPGPVDYYAIRVHYSVCRHRRKHIWTSEREMRSEFALYGTREMDAGMFRIRDWI